MPSVQMPPFWHGFGLQSSVQSSPVSSDASGGTQAQVKLPMPSVQVPEFLHGLSQQLSYSGHEFPQLKPHASKAVTPDASESSAHQSR